MKTQQSRNREGFSQQHKEQLEKPWFIARYAEVEAGFFSARTGARQGCSLHLSFSHCTGSPSYTTRKEMKG
jgi:hypothetical protein